MVNGTGTDIEAVKIVGRARKVTTLTRERTRNPRAIQILLNIKRMEIIIIRERTKRMVTRARKVI